MMKPVSLLGWLAVAGGFAYVLTRKSEPVTVVTSTPAPPATSPVTSPLPPLPSAVVILSTPLDAGLSADERTAVAAALSKETSAANLLGFASTFDPIFPVAASVLRAKAAALGKA